jgi:hypothetical protein
MINGGLPVGFTSLVKLDLQAVKLIFRWENRFTAFKNSFTGGCKIDGKTSNMMFLSFSLHDFYTSIFLFYFSGKISFQIDLPPILELEDHLMMHFSLSFSRRLVRMSDESVCKWGITQRAHPDAISSVEFMSKGHRLLN